MANALLSRRAIERTRGGVVMRGLKGDVIFISLILHPLGRFAARETTSAPLSFAIMADDKEE